ncbi:E3 ubiquitin-protein ligase Mdm2-like isoform X2 [Periplaneta americana]|uniref:E3 ubiquitin-protein ligase Mdm2-like isoform X2 n=1 Tax=Periplaneta americana TaxID=6978 RepID=UPI0037E81E15
MGFLSEKGNEPSLEMSLKRPATSEGASCSVEKLPRLNWHFVLEDESEQPTDEDEESIHSIQARETDYAKDTSDTTTHSDWSDDFKMRVEYEVASLSEKENPFGDGSLSSDTDVIMRSPTMVVFCDEEPSLLDNSSDSSDVPLLDPEVPRADYWTCVQCKNKNNNPLFRYCEKCYKRLLCVQCKRSKKFPCFSYCEVCFKVRKNFFPPRPRRRRKKRRSSNHKQSASLVKSLSTASTVSISDDTQENVGLKGEIDIAGPSNSRLDSGLGSSQESVSKSETDSQGVSSLSGVSSASSSDCNDMCITCMINPKNGIFVHGKVGHICCCYKCALRVWAVTGKCPLCKCKVNNVVKAIVQ